jgi:type I restriction-modification system DNA methylase subunit
MRTSSSPTWLGAAYEYLIGEFADSAGKKGGEFYTPRSVVRMMVRLVKPEEQHSIYDPCEGSGGMLILAKECIDEHGGEGTRADLCGQEANGTVWSIAKMNMLLRGISTADLRNDDTVIEADLLEAVIGLPADLFYGHRYPGLRAGDATAPGVTSVSVQIVPVVPSGKPDRKLIGTTRQPSWPHGRTR